MYNLIYWMPSPRFRNYFTSRTWSLDYVGKVQNSKWFMFIDPCLLFHIRWFMFVGSCLLVHVRWTILGSSWVGLGVSCLWSHAAVVLWIRLVELGIDSSILSRIVRSSRFRATVCVCVCVHACVFARLSPLTGPMSSTFYGMGLVTPVTQSEFVGTHHPIPQKSWFLLYLGMVLWTSNK